MDCIKNQDERLILLETVDFNEGLCSYLRSRNQFLTNTMKNESHVIRDHLFKIWETIRRRRISPPISPLMSPIAAFYNKFVRSSKCSQEKQGELQGPDK